MLRILRRMRRSLVCAAIAAASCSRGAPPDAYGNVEATDVIVGAEAGGRLMAFEVQEGQRLGAQAIVGSIDAAELSLERDQLAAQRAANQSRVNEVAQQIDVLQAQRKSAAAQRDAARAQRGALEAQREIARRAYDRTQRLFNQQAATAQQLDQAEREIRVLEEQIKAQDDQIAARDAEVAAHAEQIDATRAQRETTTKQVQSLDAQVAQAGERIRKSQVRNPISGTVLTTYARAGEFVQTGQPLYRIADLQSVEVRAYVGEPQLAHVHIGDAAQVSFDAGRGSRRVVSGTVSWISAQAEFAPTPIQTREERTDLVYALKIRVPNPDAALKIGMPADVTFTPPAAGR